MTIRDPYVDIHSFDGTNPSFIDDEGDIRLGWYYQYMSGDKKPMDLMTGPYGSSKECEAAAIRNWVVG